MTIEHLNWIHRNTTGTPREKSETITKIVRGDGGKPESYVSVIRICYEVLNQYPTGLRLPLSVVIPTFQLRARRKVV